VALAWLLAQGPDVVPIPGTKRVALLEQNAGASAVALSADDIAGLSKAFPPGVTAGLRYPASAMHRLGH
jgi:aryl-alcohol dehydrogenase-like predicted oxidoreductase